VGTGAGGLAMLLCAYFVCRAIWPGKRYDLAPSRNPSRDYTTMAAALLQAASYFVVGAFVELNWRAYATMPFYMPVDSSVLVGAEVLCWVLVLLTVTSMMIVRPRLGAIHLEMYLIAALTAFGCAATMQMLISHSMGWATASWVATTIGVPGLFGVGVLRWLVGRFLWHWLIKAELRKDQA
jgi:hypothetical protein